MNICSFSKSITVTTALMTAAVALTLSTPTLAAWESIGGCPSSSFAKLKARDNRPLRLMAGTTSEFAVYGHLLDTVRDISLSGINSGSASFVRGVSGFENSGSAVVGRTGPDFCALGSVVVKVTTPPTATNGQRGTLRVGGERIPVEIVVDSFSARWDDRNDSASLSPGSQEQIEADERASAETRQQGCRNFAETRYQQCVAQRPALLAERAQACAALNAKRATGGNSVVLPGFVSPCATLRSCEELRASAIASCATVKPRAVVARAPRCLRDLGGSSLFLADGSLEIKLPARERATDAQLQTCLARGFDVAIDITRANFDFGGGQCAPGVRHQLDVGSQSGGVTTRVAGVSDACASDAVLTLPQNIRQASLANGGRGVVTVRHNARRSSGSPADFYSMGNAKTTLNYVIVPPPLNLGTPVLATPPKFRAF